MKIRVFQGNDGQWYWSLKARNGQVMAQSEGYTRRQGAMRAAERLQSMLVPMTEIEANE